MRLINIKTYQLETFDNWNTTPPYAILSHTWEQEEVLFHDIATDADGMKKKRGWGKILGASVEAEKLGILYLWVDTCCIDKTSSAELSQSINSMFAWYRDARICFAYLGDFYGDNVTSFDRSRWWTRGWTLQELIAPVEVMFFAQDWTFVTLRSSSTKRIAGITGVGTAILAGGDLDKLHAFSVAEKFSWAAKRMTTCGEDRAYSLMGIFGVNMAMIYGEGEQAAYYRLQKEIFAVYPDHSIFAWDLKSQILFRDRPPKDTYDLFAPTISAFESSSDIICEPYDWALIGAPKESKPKSASNKSKQLSAFSSFSHGIRVQMLVESAFDNNFLAYLACRRRDRPYTSLTMNLVLDRNSGQYRRYFEPSATDEVNLDNYTGYKTTLEDVYIAQPRLDFAFSSRPVRCQLGAASNVPDPEFLMFLEDESAQQAGFTLETPQDPRWQRPAGQPNVQARAGLPLRRTNEDPVHVIVYRNKRTDENFAIVIRNVTESRPKPSRHVCFWITILINTVKFPLASEREHLEEWLSECQSRGSLIDLSERMVIKPLPSGKQVILGVNTFAVGTDLGFRLTVIVKEPKI